MSGANKLNNITKPVIKGERPTYHLITEEKLNDLISNSFVGSICFVLFSIFVGVSIAEKNWIYSVIGIIFLSLSIYFYWRKISLLEKRKNLENFNHLHIRPPEVKEINYKLLRQSTGPHPIILLMSHKI